jgi:acyl carrier protein phosphodiesterase
VNFLAHAWLADPDPGLIVGGVVGDWIKGPLDSVRTPALSGALLRGVRLHRAIDSFADRHPAFIRSRQRISPARRRYGGVLVDMFYDHLLARDWAHWHGQPLSSFSAKVYALLASTVAGLPAAVHPALELMCREDWLGSYAQTAGLEDVLRRMSRRARQPNPLAAGFDEMADGQFAAAFNADLAEFLPDAKAFAIQWQSAYPD